MPAMTWHKRSVDLICRFSSLRQVRFSSNVGTTVSDFALTKKGTGGGSFIELPEFKPLQDSILVKLPSSCTVFGKLSKINAISSDAKDKNGPLLAQESLRPGGFFKIMTGEHPANLIMASPTPMSNIAVVKIDSGDNNGLYVPEFEQNVLCYGGDLMLRDKNQITGFGVVALAGRGPVYQVILKDGEEMDLTSESILAYDSRVKTRLISLHSPYRIPKAVHSFLLKRFQRYYDQVLMRWNQSFSAGKIFTKIQGPGTFFLQTQFVPGSRKYTEKELLEVSRSET